MGLENLYRMKDAHKRLNQKGDVVHPITDDEMALGEHDRTLSDIFQDKKEQDRFLSSFCYEQNSDMAKDIVDSLAGGAVLTAGQNKFLEKMRKEYNVRTAEVEKVQEMLPEQIGRIAENDPRIQQIVGQLGAEKAAELLGREFASLAMSDTKKFHKVIKEMRAIHGIETQELTADLANSLQERLSAYGINEEKYWEATQGGLTIDTKEKLDNLAREQFGLFRKAIDFASGGALSHQRGKELYKNFEDQTVVLQEVDKHMKAIGKVLQGTLNADVSLAIQKAMLEGGEVHEKKLDNNLTSFSEYKTAKEEFQTTQPRWETYRDSEIKRLSIKDISAQPTALEGMKNRFAGQEYQKRKAYRPSAVFAALLAFLFGTSTKDDIKNSLT